MTRFLTAALLLLFVATNAQVETEIQAPYNIRSIMFTQTSGQNVIPIFSLNDGFTVQFDDLYGNEANYYYQIVHCDYDWRPSQLVKQEYLSGFDDIRIQTYTNSFNTLQIYSHYTISFPNRQTQLKVSGNYMLKILNEDRDVVFSRKFILYEDLVAVPLQVKRARTIDAMPHMHNMDFAIKSPNIIFQNPLKNVKVM
ncbi:type IX secretion system plug protein, partial [Flavobacterium selenitireducens]|uniref:type IX secretion system plug protein n=1 Tax=Flavobacterium selenitireducens TaxID=2722704 RepID=UPI00168A704F